jgi:hypothetical protein
MVFYMRGIGRAFSFCNLLTLKWKRKSAVEESMDFSILIPFTNDLFLIKLQSQWFRVLSRSFNALLDSKFVNAEESKDEISKGSISGVFENPGRILEHGYQSFVSCSKHEWLMRLDSDEIASRALFEFIEENLSKMRKELVIGFPRYQVVMIGQDFFTLLNSDFIPEKHMQFRFVNKHAHIFGKTVPHTYGFDLIEKNKVVAPISCAIYHLDFIVRSQDFRRQKSEVYDSLGQRKEMKNIQLGILDSPRFAPILDLEILDFLEKNRDKFYQFKMS